MRVLITGGAGFIGAHVARELLSDGHTVRALDSLVPQVHGSARQCPEYLPDDVELIVGDVRDRAMLEKSLRGMDGVVHFASLVGVGQSMYAIAEYVNVNNFGTAQLMEVLAVHPVQSLVVASSMSIYGEGLYQGSNGLPVFAEDRTVEQLKMDQWELMDEHGQALIPVPTPETKAPRLASIYALSKFDQERMALLIGGAYGIPTVALRFFNTYGPFQALSNPYTGVLSNFASRVLNGRPPLLYEDGLQKRDFVSVYDVARACRLALERPEAAGQGINISSGRAMTVKEAAEQTVRALGREDLQPEVTGKYRSGDIRHCFADISLAKTLLNWEPRVSLQQGLVDLAQWLEGQTATDRAMEAREELAARGLIV